MPSTSTASSESSTSRAPPPSTAHEPRRTSKWISASCSTTSKPARSAGAAGASAGRRRSGRRLRAAARASARRAPTDELDEGIQARAGAARGRRHRRVHSGAAGGVERAAAAVRGGLAPRPALSGARDDAAGGRVVRAGRRGAGADRRRRHISSCTSWPRRSRRPARVARALAICLELQAEAGDYRDVAARIDRLAKVQARG